MKEILDKYCELIDEFYYYKKVEFMFEIIDDATVMYSGGQFKHIFITKESLENFFKSLE